MRASLSGPAGRIEALLEEPSTMPPLGAAIVAHPHPLYHGTMDNMVVVRTARALRATGLLTLRFNFRGVGASEGVHDGQGAEEEDAAAALDFLAERHPGLTLWAAGYSFGARTVCALATREPRIERLILVALPVAIMDCACVERLAQPALAIFGGADDFGTRAELAARHPVLPERLEVDEIQGADHLFHGRTPLLEERVRDYASRSSAQKT